MTEDMIRDAEWSHLMHPADAKALEKLKADNTLTILRMIAAFGVCLVTVSFGVVAILL